VSTEDKETQEMSEDFQSIENSKPVTKSAPRGGFMNGGLPMTFLFLLAFFLISFYSGVLSERNNKLVTGGAVGTVQSASKFNAEGFKKLAADLKLDTKKFNSCLDTGKFNEAVKKEQQEGVALKVSGTPSFVINGTALVGAHPTSVFEAAIENGTFPTDPEGTASGMIYDGQKITQAIAEGEKGRIKGDPKAKVTIFEYSDFECPYCARFYSDAYKQIDEKYIKTGKAKIVFKDFPLTSLHPNAVKAAEAARCAQDQGKFWEMHDKLFELQMSSS
jgi:protein-disulfide isomerase